MAKLTKANKQKYYDVTSAYHELIRAYLADNNQAFNQALLNIENAIDDQEPQQDQNQNL